MNPCILTAPDKSATRPRGRGEPRGWGLTLSWFLTLPLLILGHSSWMLSPCPLCHEPPPPVPSVAHVDCGGWRFRKPWGRFSQPRVPSPLHTKPSAHPAPLGSASVWERLRDLHAPYISLTSSSQGVPRPWHRDLTYEHGEPM